MNMHLVAGFRKALPQIVGVIALSAPGAAVSAADLPPTQPQPTLPAAGVYEIAIPLKGADAMVLCGVETRTDKKGAKTFARLPGLDGGIFVNPHKGSISEVYNVPGKQGVIVHTTTFSPLANGLGIKADHAVGWVENNGAALWKTLPATTLYPEEMMLGEHFTLVEGGTTINRNQGQWHDFVRRNALLSAGNFQATAALFEENFESIAHLKDLGHADNPTAHPVPNRVFFKFEEAYCGRLVKTMHKTATRAWPPSMPGGSGAVVVPSSRFLQQLREDFMETGLLNNAKNPVTLQPRL